jgi:septum formation protein
MLLEESGVDFVQSPVDFDEETIVASSPKNFVYQATLGKFEAGKKLYGIDELPLLCADTVVTSQGKILRKAQSEDDARDILMTQSGQITSIVTCMIYEDCCKKLVDISTTDYLFRTFDEKKLQAYLDSGLWQGKAGACMVEGFCKDYIKEVRGFESCAMGLSVEKLLPFLQAVKN